MLYKLRTVTKAQAVADFIAKFTISRENEVINNETSSARPTSFWTLQQDGSSNEQKSRAGFILITPRPDHVKLEYALRLGVRASNNKAEYEALIVGLNMARSVGAQRLHIYKYSQLVVKHINLEYEAEGASMISNLEVVRGLLMGFEEHQINQIPRAENSNGNSLAKLASATKLELVHTIHVETLKQPNILEKEQEVNQNEKRLG